MPSASNKVAVSIMSKKMRKSKGNALMQDIASDILNESAVLTNELPEGTRDILSRVYEYTPNPNLIHVEDLRTLIKEMHAHPARLKSFLFVKYEMDIPELPQYVREENSYVLQTNQNSLLTPTVRRNKWRLWVEFYFKKKRGNAKFKVMFTRRYDPVDSEDIYINTFDTITEYRKTFYKMVDISDVVNNYKFLYSLKDMILCGIANIKKKKGCNQIVDSPGYKIICGKECFGGICFKCKQKRLIEHFKFKITKTTV